ncbi:MAG: hypothetical protein KKB13_11090 [Chloroflexi bacterium]|nr:hypothetical protein [Chloroflexota bacterium]
MRLPAQLNRRGPLPPPTQDHIPIRAVHDNVIIRRDGALVAIIGIQGVNMNMLDPATQDRLIADYRDMLTSLEFGLQTLIIARPQDIEGHLQQLRERAEAHRREGNLLYYQLLLRYIDFYHQLAWDAMALVREYRIAALYLHPGLEQIREKIGRRTMTVDLLNEGLAELDHRIRLLQAHLEQMGLRTWVLSGDEVKRELYLFYHPALQAEPATLDQAPHAIRGDEGP